MRRLLSLSFALACHGLFLGVYAWMAAFVGNFSFGFLPTLDGPATMDLAPAIAIDVALALLFALQHSVMARPRFKQWWTRIVPAQLERSFYVLASCLAVAALMLFWQPVGGVVWDVQSPIGRTFLTILFALGWFLVPAVTFLLNHFDLLGTRQAWLYFRGKQYTSLAFRTPGPYRFVRHPLYVGWLIAFWATPTMTVTHLLFAGLMTAYILAAIPIEERDLIAHHGETYASYRRRVGMLIPRLRPQPVPARAALADPAESPAA